MSSDDPAPGSLTVFQSSRVARPQDASKAPYLVSLLSSSARFYLDAYKQRMLRPLSEVADMETWLVPAGRYVDPVFRTVGDPTWVSSAIWLRLVPSGLLEMLLNTLVSFSLPRKLGLNGSLLMFVPATDMFRYLHLDQEGLCHVEFQETPEDAQNWFVGSADIKNALHQMRIFSWLQAFFCFFCNARYSRIRSWSYSKNDRTITSCSRFFDISCLSQLHFQWAFFG